MDNSVRVCMKKERVLAHEPVCGNEKNSLLCNTLNLQWKSKTDWEINKPKPTNLDDTFVSYESINRELKRRLIYEYRCNERLKTKDVGSTRLTCTGFLGGLEHLKIETRLIDEKYVSVMGECVI